MQARPASRMVAFPLLADVRSYRASTFDYLRPAEGQPSAQDWCNVFRQSVPEFQRLASQDPAMPEAEREVLPCLTILARSRHAWIMVFNHA